jgi:hypothetical protein
MGKMGKYMKILVGKHKGKGPPKRSWHKWEDNIKIDMSSSSGLRIGMILMTVMILWVPEKVRNFLTS